MKLLIDMNLTPRWCRTFERRGVAATHWTSVGAATAPDEVILRWAREHQHVIFTHDLDFGALLALTHADGPSVVQVRTRLPIPEGIGEELLQAIRRHQDALEAGALLTVHPDRSRIRLLPIRRGR